MYYIHTSASNYFLTTLALHYFQSKFSSNWSILKNLAGLDDVKAISSFSTDHNDCKMFFSFFFTVMYNLFTYRQAMETFSSK